MKVLSTSKYSGYPILVGCRLTIALHAQVCQPWDAKKFNFQKALQQEILFQYEAGLQDDGNQPKFIPASPANNSPNLVFINVSPIEYGHVLLVPRVMDDLTQLVDQTSMRLALQFCEHSSNPYFRLCYNSLGAYGTINHLHFQVRSLCINCTAFINCLPSHMKCA
jgi:GDP-L-galactose phosphorylase